MDPVFVFVCGAALALVCVGVFVVTQLEMNKNLKRVVELLEEKK